MHVAAFDAKLCPPVDSYPSKLLPGMSTYLRCLSSVLKCFFASLYAFDPAAQFCLLVAIMDLATATMKQKSSKLLMAKQ